MSSQPQRKGRLLSAKDAYTGKQGLIYNVGVSAETVGARALHMQVATIPPLGRGKAHKHPAHETAIYALTGVSGVWHGDNLEHHDLVRPGDFFYIPANVAHLPYNPSDSEEVVVLIARTDPNEQEHVALLPELDALHLEPTA